VVAVSPRLPQLKRLQAAGLSIAAALLLSSCGGGGDEQPLTKAEYVKQANAICKKGVEAKDSVVQALLKAQAQREGKPSKKDYEALITAALPALQDMTQELAGLSAPSKGEKVANRMVDQFEAAVKKAEEDPGSALQTDPFEDATETARSYGIENCSL
jgi:hypothetical protein